MNGIRFNTFEFAYFLKGQLTQTRITLDYAHYLINDINVSMQLNENIFLNSFIEHLNSN